MSRHWTRNARRLLYGMAAVLMAGCSAESEFAEKRATREEGYEPPPAEPVLRQRSQPIAPTCGPGSCTLPRAFTSLDKKRIGETLQGYSSDDDFLFEGGSSGKTARQSFQLRDAPTQADRDECPLTAQSPASCEQIRLALPVPPTQAQMDQCMEDVIDQMQEYSIDTAPGACKKIYLYDRAVEMQRDFLPVMRNYSNSQLTSILGQELAKFGGGSPGNAMVQNFVANQGAPMTWNNASSLSQDVRASGQLAGAGKVVDKSIEALRQWVNTQGAGCPDWTKLEQDVLGEDVVSPLANFAPTGNIFSPGWRLQGPLGGTQALQVRLAAWNVNTSTRTVSGTLQVVVGDDFGVSDSDVYSPGLLAFWILQHQRGIRPFNNLVEVDYPFSFQYEAESVPADLPAGSGELGAKLRMKDNSRVRAAYCGGQGELSSTAALSQPTFTVLGSTLAEVGSFVKDNELIFRIQVQDTVENQTYTYVTGPAGRNPDGKPHARIKQLGPEEFLISFEDRFIPRASPAAIDYDDVLILVRGKLELETGCKCPMGDQLDIYYNWTSADGRDLDTRTSLTAPFTSYDLGWNRDTQVGEITPLLYWHGDNTGWSGNERVTVYLNELRSAFPSSTEFRVGLKAFWFGERVAGYTRVTVSGCLNNNDVYYQPQLTTNAVAADHPGEMVGELIIRLDSENNPTGFTIDTSGTDLGGDSEAPFCRQ